MAKWKKIIGLSLSKQEFDDWLALWPMPPTAWKPRGLTLHHTAAPSLAQRPGGLTAQHIQNLQAYYRDEKGWSCGPHLFVDQQKVHLFSPMGAMGTHARSFNSTHIGLEMLGDYDSEAVHPGVWDISVHVAARLMQKFRWAGVSEPVLLSPTPPSPRRNGVGTKTTVMNFHRDDPKTSKTCPGMRVAKSAWWSAIEGRLHDFEAKHPVERLVGIYLDGKKTAINGRIYGDAGVVMLNADDASVLFGILPQPPLPLAQEQPPQQEQATLVPVASALRSRGYGVTFEKKSGSLYVTRPTRKSDKEQVVAAS